jgi:hypothetical protein
MIERAMIENVATVNWKFPELLEQHDTTAYQVVKHIGDVGLMGSIYKLAEKDKRPTRANFETIGKIITALREITGEDITLEDLLEYSPDDP